MELIELRIMDRDYRLTVSADDRDRLLQAASMVDARMRDIRDSGKLSSPDRIAVLAALQFAHQLIGESESTAATSSAETQRRVRRLNDALATELKAQDSLF
jgi:cell division protein ZapA